MGMGSPFLVLIETFSGPLLSKNCLKRMKTDNISKGVYILANDVVYDQLVALLNSIEVNAGKDMPICIIPYNNMLERIKKYILPYKNIRLFEDSDAIDKWDAFFEEVWAAYPRRIYQRWSRPWFYKGKTGRAMVAFDGPFDRFVYCECDNLVMKPMDDVFEKLNNYDFVFDDWEHTKPTPVAALNIPLIEKTGLFSESDIRPKFHCGSFFGSKKGIFNNDELARYKDLLLNKREFEWVNSHGWWDFVFLFNYLTLRSGRPLFNFTLSPDNKDITGNCANADPFVNINNVLYNQGRLKPIHRIHYMGYPGILFTRLCRGECVDIRYKDVFLHYRFLKEPEDRPRDFVKPSRITIVKRFMQKIIKKIGRICA